MRFNTSLPTVAVAQVCATDNDKDNLDKAFTLIETASMGGADLIAFPECFLYIGDERKYGSIAEPIEGRLTEQFRLKAQKFNISILLGSIIEKVEGEKKFYNTSILIDKTGEICCFYRKIHLYDVCLPNVKIQESDRFIAGKKVVAYHHDMGILGFSICYDLRFPSLYQKLRQKGAQIIFVPAAFTLHTGKDHWLPLLKARAIENQVYIVAPAQYGVHGHNRQSYGNSVIIDPWGTIISHCGEKEGLIYGEIDLAYLESVRQNMPVQQHQAAGIDI